MSDHPGYAASAPVPRDTPPMHRLAALLGLVVAFGWTYLLAGRSQSVADVHQDLVTIGAEWTIVLVLAAIAFGLQRKTFAYFRLRMPGARDVLVVLGAFVATFVLVGIAGRFVTMPTSGLDISQLGQVAFPLRLGLVFTAAVCEEFMYRGFGIEELNDLTGSWWLAGAISWAGFTLAHVDRYGWSPALAIPAIAGALLTLVYLWRRNLPASMLLHFMIDGFTILLAPLYMHPR